MISLLFRRKAGWILLSLSCIAGSLTVSGTASEAQQPRPLITRDAFLSTLSLRLPSTERAEIPALRSNQPDRSVLMFTNADQHESRWRKYAVRGAIVGLVGGLGLVVFLPCDQNCQSGDFGRAGRLAGVPVAVALGAAIGAGIGVIVDKTHGT